MTSAVRHSAGMPRVGRVFVFWRGKNLPKIITETIHGGLPVTHVNDPALWPAASQCHLYITSAGLTETVWRAAQAMSPVPPVVLPEAGEWLRDKIIELTRLGDVFLFMASKAGDRL
jgi:hypothetical protein